MANSLPYSCAIFIAFLSITLINNCNGFNIDQLCPRILHHVFEGYAPIGNSKAGNYTENLKAATINTCVNECCELRDNCNAAFVYNKTCYHVKCAKNELCLPLKIANVTTKLQMVLVNPVNEDDPSWLEILKTSHLQDYSEAQTHLAKVPSYFDKNELTDAIYNLPQYSDELTIPSGKRVSDLYGDRNSNYGFERFSNDQYINDDSDLKMDESKTYPGTTLISCEVGIDTMCPVNEECIQLISKSRQGVCNCITNYIRNDNGKCIKMRNQILSEAIANELLGKNINNFNAESNGGSEPNAKPLITDTSESPQKQITVSVVSKNVRLPEKEVTLAAYTIPDEKSSGDKYKYVWTLISQPSGDINGTITDQTKDKVKLSNLSEGLYQFKVAVTGNSSFGEAYANVSVLPEKRINKPPEVIITPVFQTVKLPNSEAILDGSTSKDDDNIVAWHWDLLQGPIGYQPTLPETSTLQLTDLTAPGNYTFKLTVTDSDNAQNSTTASITVLKGIDYPPEANAGSDVIVYFPHNNLTLNGSLSTDDREIVAWEWTKDSSDPKAVDMQNTRTPYLQLSNLELGIYKFILKVTDASGQSSLATVHVFVKPPNNLPPLANAGKNTTINLPQTWAILNATMSTDDVKISNYLWKQLSGPTVSVIDIANSSIANATRLTIGNYVFEISVMDENNNNGSDKVFITVVQEKNTPPIANAGGDQSLSLPLTVIILNGTKSSDDLGIISYVWTRESNSLAMGTVIGTSDSEPILMVTNLVPGRYVFRLVVTDAQGLTGTDTVSVIVRPDPLLYKLVELTLEMDATVLTTSELETLQQKLVLLLGDNIKLHLRELKVEQKTGEAVLVFYVENTTNREGKLNIMSGLEVERILKEKFWRDAGILGSSISGIRTSVCQNICSGHGICNAETRACMCETFWMPDIFYFWGVGEANCDWSILYVIIGTFVGFLILSGICWGITCLCRRTPKPRSRNKPMKYALLGTQDDEIPPFNRSGTVLSDTDTDSDVLFESRTKQNGNLRSNGETRNGNPKYSVTRLGRRIKT